ncbi:MAG: hypothetical protein AAB875_07630 [Patescibacteria group bacterium]
MQIDIDVTDLRRSLTDEEKAFLLTKVPIRVPARDFHYNRWNIFSTVTDYGSYMDKIRSFPTLEQGTADFLVFIKSVISDRILGLSEVYSKESKEFVDEVHVLFSRQGYQIVFYFKTFHKEVKPIAVELAEEFSELPPAVQAELTKYKQPGLLKDILFSNRGKIRSALPERFAKDEIAYYIWRETTFNTGLDSCMPVAAEWRLSYYFRQQGFDDSIIHKISAWLDKFVLHLNLSLKLGVRGVLQAGKGYGLIP